MNEKEAIKIWKNKIPFSHGKRGVVSKSVDGKYLIKEKKPSSEASGTVMLEYEYNLKLNKYEIGPRMIYYNKENDFLIREFIDGETIFEHIDELKKNKIKKESDKKLKDMIVNILDQCRRMDIARINKFEMTNPHKDLIIEKKTEKPFIIDFERCRYSDKPKNTTQFCQFLMKGRMEAELNAFGIQLNREKIILLAEIYKSNQTEENYKKIRDEIEKRLS
jgi:predicted Ser/Thr protein kinase